MNARRIAAAVAFVIIGAAPLCAKPPSGLTLDPTIAAWFRSLRNPKTGAYCCDTADGRVLHDDAWRTAGDDYEVLLDGAWRRVPPDAVLDRIANPTGGAVVFAAGTAILCFVRPSET